MGTVKRVYVAAPYGRHGDARAVHEILRSLKMEPTSRWCELAAQGVDTTLEAFAIDRADLARAEGVIAILDQPGGRETYAEIEVARTMGIPIIYFGDHASMSLQYAELHGRAYRCDDARAAATLMYMLAATRDLTEAAVESVRVERDFQNAKWHRSPGDWPATPERKVTVLGEEFGEVCRAILDREPLSRLRAELVQVAAVAVAFVEVIDAGNEPMPTARVPGPPDPPVPPNWHPVG